MLPPHCCFRHRPLAAKLARNAIWRGACSRSAGKDRRCKGARMDWKGRRGSSNIEDRRSAGGRGRGAARTGGLGGVGLIAVVVIGYFLGIDVTPLLQGQGPGDTAASPSNSSGPDKAPSRSTSATSHSASAPRTSGGARASATRSSSPTTPRASSTHSFAPERRSVRPSESSTRAGS